MKEEDRLTIDVKFSEAFHISFFQNDLVKSAVLM